MKKYIIAVLILLIGGFLMATATSIFSVPQGGTGWSSLYSNSVLLGNGVGRISTTTAGTNGYVLALSGGIPTWTATSSFGTVTSVAATVPVGMKISGTPITTTGTLAFGFDLMTSYIPFGGTSNVLATSTTFSFNNTASRLTATYASSTAISGTSANFTNFYGTLTGNADTAAALANNGANCSANQYPLGVDASGAVESCTADANTTYTAGDNLTLTGTDFDFDDPFSVNGGTITYASSTAFSSSYASSTLLYGSELQTCNSTTGKLTWTNGKFACGTDYNTGGTYDGDFTWETTWNTLSAATTSPIWAKAGLYASSTSIFNNATGTQLTLTDLFISDDQISDFQGDGFALSGTSLIFDCSDVVSTGLQCSGEDLQLNATGDWTGTIDTNNFAGGAIGAGELLYGSAVSTISELAPGTSGYILMSGGTTAPSWVSTSTFIMSTEIDTFAELDAIVADGDLAVLSSAMTGTFDGVDFGNGTLGQNALWYGGAAAIPSELAIGTNGDVFIVSGGIPAWFATSSIPLGGDVTGTLSATVVGNDSHTHDATTISGLGTDDISGLDISADTNLTGGRSLTLTDDDMLADVELYTYRIGSFNIGSSTMSTTTGAFMQITVPIASTITSISCSTNIGTSTIQLEERDAATPNTAGTDILYNGSLGLQCGSGIGQTASTTVSNNTLDTGDIINLEITDAAPVGGTKPSIIRVHIVGTKND